MSLKQIANIRIGICSVTFNGVDLGHTLDGVSFDLKRTFVPLMVDKYGTTPIDQALQGTDLDIKMKFAEPVLDLLQQVYPEGDWRSGTAGKRMGLGADAGTLVRANSYQLTLHPVSMADTSEDIVIYNAVNINNIVLEYSIKNQRVIECSFQALVNESQVSGRRLGHIGLTNVS